MLGALNGWLLPSWNDHRSGVRVTPPLYGGPYTCQDDKTAFPCIVYRRLQVRLDGHFCAVHAVADTLRSVCLTIFVFAAQVRMNFSHGVDSVTLDDTDDERSFPCDCPSLVPRHAQFLVLGFVWSVFHTFRVLYIECKQY